MTDKPAMCPLVREGNAATCPAGLDVPRGTMLTRGALRSVAVLVLLALLVTGANLLWTAHTVRSFQSSQQKQDAAQQRQDEVVKERLCTTLSRLTALKPPAGPAARNPGRAYLQAQHGTLAQFGPDLGCKG